jgi:hypothetical protein
MVAPLDPALEEVRQRYLDRDLVLFVGAGVSAAAGLPGWGPLIKQLVERAKAKHPAADLASEVEALLATSHYVEAITAVAEAVGEQDFVHAVTEALDDRKLGKSLPAVAQAIAGLAPHLRAVMTTNLDGLLERAFAGTWPVLHRATGNVTQQGQVIFKVHGTLLDPDTWVMTRDQYDRAMYNDPRLSSAVAAAFQARTLLFVGYGLADDDFDQVLARIRALSGGAKPRHFALVKGSQITDRWRKAREGAGIRVIPFAEYEDLPGILAWIAGGAPPPPPPPAPTAVYVHRHAEEKAALALLDEPGKPVVLWGPDRFGKTTLLRYLLGSVRDAGGAQTRIVEVDLGVRLPDPPTLDGLLQNLAADLVHQLGGDEAWLDELEQKRRLGWDQRLEMLLHDRLLPAAPGRLVLAIDNADAVWEQPFAPRFYRLLRSFCEKTQDPWPRLRLALLLSSTPSLVFHDSPLTNLSTPIALGDLGTDQIVEMARLHELTWDGPAVEEHVRPLLGGHPYLLHRFMDHAHRAGAPLAALATDINAVEDLFTEELAALGRDMRKDPHLRDAMARLLADPHADLREGIVLRLRRAGLVERARDGGYRIRYGLYDSYLRRRWLKKAPI